jgi:hypothetical protein
MKINENPMINKIIIKVWKQSNKKTISLLLDRQEGTHSHPARLVTANL